MALGNSEIAKFQTFVMTSIRKELISQMKFTGEASIVPPGAEEVTRRHDKFMRGIDRVDCMGE